MLVSGLAGDCEDSAGCEAQRLDCEICYRAVFEAVPDPVLLVDERGRIVDANPAAARLYGCPCDAMRGKSAATLFAQPAPLDGLFITLPGHLPAGVHLRRDGSRFSAEVTVSYIQQRHAPLAILLVRDVTAAREAVSRLEEAEERWRFALEGAGDALWDWSLESGEIKVSASFKTIIGWPDGSPLQGNDIWPERVHRDDLRMATGAFSAHLSGTRPITEVEFRLRLEDGSFRWVALRGKVMQRDATGRPLRMIGTVRDVHEHYLIEEREKRQQQELDRAARLIHVGEMASALAHELNQPLTALRNFSAVALRRLEELGVAGERIRDPLKMIAEQSLRAGEIVHRVRGFVRKGGQVTAPVALNGVVRDIVRFTEFEARAHAVQFVLDLAEPLPAVQADQVQLEQVLSNLVKNAIDAMSAVAGERILRIQTRAVVDNMVEVAVIDSGEGLADAVRSDPFAPFVTTKPEGVGLGLAICRTIIENHGGRLWVEDSTDRGTTFCLCLPSLAG
jgi:two-component system, LuxR family, sensor kinase FixL